MAAGPVGDRVVAGRYRLLARLGAGAMGTVWRAFDCVLETEAALKEIELAGGVAGSERADRVERAMREARHAAKLRGHPHVVTILDVVLENGLPWIVMELVPSRSLFEVVRDDGPLSPARAARVGLAVLDALIAARDHGIVHRDVKPSNVLIGTDGRTVLTDFGIATGDGDPTLTVTGVLGTPLYMAPERLNNYPATFDGDLFSLGGTLYFALEGRPPFERDSFGAMLAAIVLHPPAPAPHAGPLAPVLDGLLEKDPQRRIDPEHARELLRRVTRPPVSLTRIAQPARTEQLTWNDQQAPYDQPDQDDQQGQYDQPAGYDEGDPTRLAARTRVRPPPSDLPDQRDPTRAPEPERGPSGAGGGIGAPPVPVAPSGAETPRAPTDLTAAVQEGAVVLRWAPSTTPGVSYRVCRVLADPTAPGGRRERGLGITTATELSDAGVPRGVTYWHEVVAVLTGASGRRRSAAARTAARTLAPAVTALRATMTGDAVELSWRPMPHHDEVIIERTFAESSALSGAKRRFRGAGGHFVDTDVAPSAVYRYRLWVAGPDGSDALAPTDASQVVIRVVARPRPVLDLEARATLGGTVLRWTTVPGTVVRVYATENPTQSGLAGTGPFGPADREVSLSSLQGRARLVGESRRGRLVDRQTGVPVVYTPITVAEDRAVIGTAVDHTGA
ncbi:eukaryotic-like serine/threonine-protein kinase [Frankia sp. AiPs1]|uniref:serine/threonine-protein kinase n=1 Tax=Frankia sp. AiPa1 TaxID=573492 RepID=UPI00202B2A7A|nr:serine/threonine-protein kinase [Frankia sp. AiPa1]MCL9762023.1 serine/threonine protein kinase [Frankia sp. AiPa1]